MPQEKKSGFCLPHTLREPARPTTHVPLPPWTLFWYNYNSKLNRTLQVILFDHHSLLFPTTPYSHAMQEHMKCSKNYEITKNKKITKIKNFLKLWNNCMSFSIIYSNLAGISVQTEQCVPMFRGNASPSFWRRISKNHQVPKETLGQGRIQAPLLLRTRLSLGGRDSPLVLYFRMCHLEGLRQSPHYGSSRGRFPRNFLHRPHTGPGKGKHQLQTPKRMEAKTQMTFQKVISHHL